MRDHRSTAHDKRDNRHRRQHLSLSLRLALWAILRNYVVNNINWLMLSISSCGDGIGQELAKIRVELKSDLKEWLAIERQSRHRNDGGDKASLIDEAKNELGVFAHITAHSQLFAAL